MTYSSYFSIQFWGQWRLGFFFSPFSFHFCFYVENIWALKRLFLARLSSCCCAICCWLWGQMSGVCSNKGPLPQGKAQRGPAALRAFSRPLHQSSWAFSKTSARYANWHRVSDLQCGEYVKPCHHILSFKFSLLVYESSVLGLIWEKSLC